MEPSGLHIPFLTHFPTGKMPKSRSLHLRDQKKKKKGRKKKQNRLPCNVGLSFPRPNQFASSKGTCGSNTSVEIDAITCIMLDATYYNTHPTSRSIARLCGRDTTSISGSPWICRGEALPVPFSVTRLAKSAFSWRVSSVFGIRRDGCAREEKN